MKNCALLFTFLLVITSISAQNLKVYTPKGVTKWDISEISKKRFEKMQSLVERMNPREGQEPLTDEEYKLIDSLQKFVPEPEKYIFSSTETVGCSWYEGVLVDSTYSTSHLADYKGIKYSDKNIHDFDVSTAWVEGVKGNGIGEKITIQLSSYIHVSVTGIKIFNGYMKSEKTWRENGRAKKLKVYANGKPYAILNLRDIIGEQIFEVDTQDFGKKPMQLTFEIVDVYRGSKYKDVAISEINFDGLGVHCFAQGTMVQMADGTEKPIEDITKGDEVLTYNFELGKTETASVEAFNKVQHHNLVQLEVGNKQITVTDDHPFYVEGKGWCSINGFTSTTTSYLGKISKLEIGDNIKGLEGNNFEVKSMKTLKSCEWTYTITKLDKGNSFYANGLLVAVE